MPLHYVLSVQQGKPEKERATLQLGKVEEQDVKHP